MGSFINSASDAEICEVLNKRFSGDDNGSGQTYLNELRQFFQSEKLFDKKHKLNRVFHRLAISVTGGSFVPKNDHSRWRWFHLLKANLPNAVEQALRSQLTLILSPGSSGNPAGGVDYVIFSTIHQKTQSGDQFELWDGVTGGLPADHLNNSVPYPLSDAGGNSYCAFILECHDDQKLDDAPGEDDPPQSDGGNVEKGPIPYSKPKPMKKPPKKPPVKKPAKKSVKKTSKKAAKKTAKKVAKKKPSE